HPPWASRRGPLGSDAATAVSWRLPPRPRLRRGREPGPVRLLVRAAGRAPGGVPADADRAAQDRLHARGPRAPGPAAWLRGRRAAAVAGRPPPPDAAAHRPVRGRLAAHLPHDAGGVWGEQGGDRPPRIRRWTSCARVGPLHPAAARREQAAYPRDVR